MKRFLTPFLILTLAACGCLQAQSPPLPQLPPDYKSHITLYRSNVLELLLSGDNHTPAGPNDELITPFQFKSFRGINDVQLVGRAPECHIDRAGHRAWDSGPIVLFTPTSNVWVQGQGFLFIETNHLLTISNQVETRIMRALLKRSMANVAETNAPETNAQVLKIFSDWGQFDYQANVARFSGHVHVIDPQLDMTSDKLAVHMTSNSVVQTILAEDNVVLTTTNKGSATAPRAFYYMTNGSQMTELTGGAAWHNGDQKAWADKFVYDSTNHILTGEGNVRVWWPTNAPGAAGSAPQDGSSGYRKLWADFARLQWPLTNGPIEKMRATGNVVIVNQADQSQSKSDEADYSRSKDLFELTGHPEWWNDTVHVWGKLLMAEATNRVYHARGDSILKMKTGGATHTNQWLYIASDTLDYHTNFAVFTDHVKARLLEDNALRDTLASDTLDVDLFSNEVKTAIARGHVQGETAPDKAGRVKTVDCDLLTANRNPVTKMLTEIVAEDHAVLRQFGTNVAEPRDTLTAHTVTAYFSAAVTNQLERAVADRDVVIDQVKTNGAIHATASRGVYTVVADEVKLTGSPFARTEKNIVSDAEYLIWRPKTNSFRAFGIYSIAPVNTNQAAKPSAPLVSAVSAPKHGRKNTQHPGKP